MLLVMDGPSRNAGVTVIDLRTPLSPSREGSLHEPSQLTLTEKGCVRADKTRLSSYPSVSASAELPADGWSFDYISIEGSRLGRDVFRPAVPIRIGSTEFSPRIALVDSGSEHALAPTWIADQVGIDLHGCPILELGIGGRIAIATFADVELHLHREHDSNEHVSWITPVGFVEPWDARFTIVLGQSDSSTNSPYP